MSAAGAVTRPPYDKAETRRAIDAVDLADLVRRDGVALQRVGQVLQGCCPLPDHEDSTASFTVYPPGRGWYCFGCGRGGDAARYIMLTRGCSFPAALAYLGIGDGERAPLVPLAPRPASARRKAPAAPLPTRPADVVYPYQDAVGVVRYQVLRWDLTPAEQPRYNGATKLIRHAGPDGRPGMPAGVAPLLYRLPTLLAADPALPVFVCEGEKDADRLAAAGLVSTCNSGGAGHWPARGSQHLAGRQVIILPDNDEAGRRHAALVADELRPVAAAVTVLALPGLADHGDVSDFLALHTVDALQVLAAFAAALPPAAVAGAVDPATGELVITGADTETTVATANLIAALQARAEAAEQQARHLINWQKVPNVQQGVRAVAPFVVAQYKQKVSACEADADGWVSISLPAVVESQVGPALPSWTDRTPEEHKAVASRAEQVGIYIRDMATYDWIETKQGPWTRSSNGGHAFKPVFIRPKSDAFLHDPLALPTPAKRTARPRKPAAVCPRCHQDNTRQVVCYECLTKGCKHIFTPEEADNAAELLAAEESSAPATPPAAAPATVGRALATWRPQPQDPKISDLETDGAIDPIFSDLTPPPAPESFRLMRDAVYEMAQRRANASAPADNCWVCNGPCTGNCARAQFQATIPPSGQPAARAPMEVHS